MWNNGSLKMRSLQYCKTGTKALIAIQFNAKKFPRRCLLMKICQWFSTQTLKNALFKNMREIWINLK